MNELACMSWESDAQFAELSDEGRRKVRDRIVAVERIEKATRGSRGTTIKREGIALGLKPVSMRRLVTLYTHGGGRWQSLIDRRGEPHKAQQLPLAFVDFWKSLCEDNGRKNRPAWKELRRLYWTRATVYVTPKGQRIELWPGYAERPGASPTSPHDLPRGWSYQNLMLPEHRLSQLEEDFARIGPIAASELQEMILTTRKGMKPGQHYIPDDCWVDLKVTVAPTVSRFPARPVELGCGDLASAKKIAWGLTPMITSDKGKRNYIKKCDMRYLLAQILCLVGFHRDGVTFWVEHGSAGIWPELEELIVQLAAACGYSITVKRSGIKGGKALGGGFETLGKGNYRFKAAYESNHNLCHNERANLPGQTGSNSRLNAVEDLVGRDRETTEILTASLEYRPAVRDSFRTGYMTFGDYIWAHAKVERHIGDYTDHQLEGWEDNMVSLYRMATDAPWRPMAELLGMEPMHRAAMDALFANVPDLTRTRRMSRNEVWERGKAELVRLPLHCVPLILGPEFAKDRTVGDDSMFTFRDQDCGDELLVYSAKATRADGSPERLQPKKTYRTWVNPFDASLLFVATIEGAYIGTCESKERLERGDEAAFHREASRVKAEQTEMLAPARARQLQRNRVNTETRKANIRLGQGGPATEAERAFAAHPLPDLGSTLAEDVQPDDQPVSDDPFDSANLL